MRFLVAPDGFKESLDSALAARAIERGILAFDQNAKTTLLPLSDGGDGFSTLLTQYTGGNMTTAKAQDPLGRPLTTKYGWNNQNKVAVIDVSKASGLALLKANERNPLKTTSFGTGELILKAVEKGAKQIILGLGGSATIDMGIGMAAALGFAFADKNGRRIAAPKGRDMVRVASVRPSPNKDKLKSIRFIAACDVTNPLTGPKGAVQVYGKQKGASPSAMSTLEKGIDSLSRVLQRDLRVRIKQTEGTGAAGGIGAGATTFLNAELVSGAEFFFNATHLNKHIKKADCIFTGEGRLDKQFFHGKLLQRLASRVLPHKKPLIAIVGSIDLKPKERRTLPFDYVGSTATGPMTLGEAMKNAESLLAQKAYEVARLLHAGSNEL